MRLGRHVHPPVSSPDEFFKPHKASGGGKVISAELLSEATGACFHRLEDLNFTHLIRMFLHIEPNRASAHCEIPLATGLPTNRSYLERPTQGTESDRRK